MPRAIAKNKKAKSSGSLTGVLNLITDKAPTNPKDKANDDFTIKITRKVMLLKRGIIVDIWIFDEREFALCLYTYIKIKEEIKQKNKLNTLFGVTQTTTPRNFDPDASSVTSFNDRSKELSPATLKVQDYSIARKYIKS